MADDRRREIMADHFDFMQTINLKEREEGVWGGHWYNIYVTYDSNEEHLRVVSSNGTLIFFNHEELKVEYVQYNRGNPKIIKRVSYSFEARADYSTC
jgi:hypothetical protein